MSGLREALVNGLTHYNFCYAEIHASGPSIATPEEVELVADAVLRVLAEHGDTQQVREEIAEAIGDSASHEEALDRTMSVVARIVAARDDAVEQAEWSDKVRQNEADLNRPLRADLAAARQQLDQVRALHSPEEGQHPDFCGHDKHQLPCPTLRALDVPAMPEVPR